MAFTRVAGSLGTVVTKSRDQLTQSPVPREDPARRGQGGGDQSTHSDYVGEDRLELA
jgi:hypothetical protein